MRRIGLGKQTSTLQRATATALPVTHDAADARQRSRPC